MNKTCRYCQWFSENDVDWPWYNRCDKKNWSVPSGEYTCNEYEPLSKEQLAFLAATTDLTPATPK